MLDDGCFTIFVTSKKWQVNGEMRSDVIGVYSKVGGEASPEIRTTRQTPGKRSTARLTTTAAEQAD